MFNEILDKVYTFFPRLETVSAGEDRSKAAEYFAPLLLKEVKTLMATAQAIFSPDIFSRSFVDNMSFPDPSPEICKVQIRPDAKYYQHLKRDLPYPENPTGVDATGLALHISVFTGFETKEKEYVPAILIRLLIWGEQERRAFKKFYYNYRRTIEILLKMADVDFETACYFEKLAKYHGDNIVKKLDIYFNEQDDEDSFFFLKGFSGEFDTDRLIKTFLVLTALYDSCYSYLVSRKDMDKIVGHYEKLRE